MGQAVVTLDKSRKTAIDNRMSEPWRVQTLSSYEQIQANRHVWLELEKSCKDPQAAFQGYVWCECWARIYCKNDAHNELLIQMIYCGEVLTAILPLMVNSKFGIRTLTLLGEPHSQLANVVSLTGTDCSEGINLAINQASEFSKADVFAVGPIPQNSTLASAFPLGILKADPAQEISLVKWPNVSLAEEYYENLPKNRRKGFRKKLRRLEAQGDVTFERYDADSDQFKSYVELALSWKLEWLSRSGRISAGLEYEKVAEFLAGFEQHNGGYHLEVEVLSVSQIPVAILLNLTGKHFRQCYLSAHDHAYSNVSPGTLVDQFSIGQSIEDDMIAHSFLGHPTPFKKMWATDYIPLLCHQRAVTKRGQAWLQIWINGSRRLIKKLFLQLPTILSAPPIRAMINALRSQTKSKQ